eukprot:gene20613-biopygen20615
MATWMAHCMTSGMLRMWARGCSAPPTWDQPAAATCQTSRRGGRAVRRAATASMQTIMRRWPPSMGNLVETAPRMSCLGSPSAMHCFSSRSRRRRRCRVLCLRGSALRGGTRFVLPRGRGR